jgi:hypothetical protein
MSCWTGPCTGLADCCRDDLLTRVLSAKINNVALLLLL